MKKNNKYKTQRRSNLKNFKKIFVIAAEGKKTELSYLRLVKKIYGGTFHIDEVTYKNSSPREVLNQMRKKLLQVCFTNDPYEAWIVIDRDHWNTNDIRKIHEWSKEKENYGAVLSNPNFERWLLFHFEDGCKQIKNPASNLKKILPCYNKVLKKSDLKKHNVEKAVERAKKCHEQEKFEEEFEDFLNCTSVYKLVEKIIQS